MDDFTVREDVSIVQCYRSDRHLMFHRSSGSLARLHVLEVMLRRLRCCAGPAAEAPGHAREHQKGHSKQAKI